MSEIAKGKYRLVNAYEELVFSTVKSLMNKETDMCKCEKCFLDVCAIVLNKGFCRFVTTEQGELLARIPDINDSRDIELIVTAVEAIKLVRAHPAH